MALSFKQRKYNITNKEKNFNFEIHFCKGTYCVLVKNVFSIVNVNLVYSLNEILFV